MPLFIVIILAFVLMLSLADSNSDLIKKFTRLDIPVINIIYVKLTIIAARMNRQYETTNNDNITISVVGMSDGIALKTKIKVSSNQFSKKVCAEFLKKIQYKLSSQLLAYMTFPYSPHAFRNEIR
jgi:uncharacterized membrane protein YoaK (UPF0700 family)